MSRKRGPQIISLLLALTAQFIWVGATCHAVLHVLHAPPCACHTACPCHQPHSTVSINNFFGHAHESENCPFCQLGAHTPTVVADVPQNFGELCQAQKRLDPPTQSIRAVLPLLPPTCGPPGLFA